MEITPFSSIKVIKTALCEGMLSCFSHVQLFVTRWTVACWAPQLQIEINQKVSSFFARLKTTQRFSKVSVMTIYIIVVLK